MGLFDRFRKKEEKKEKLNIFKKVLSTDSGMWGLWDYETYKTNYVKSSNF
jgi:hypothetical protein